MFDVRVGDTGGPRGHGPPTFLRSKKKKRKTRKKRTIFKEETIERLSPRSKYYCFSHSRVSRIQKFFLSANHGGRQYFSGFHGPSTLKSISSALMMLLISQFSSWKCYFVISYLFYQSSLMLKLVGVFCQKNSSRLNGISKII